MCRQPWKCACCIITLLTLIVLQILVDALMHCVAQNARSNSKESKNKEKIQMRIIVTACN